MDEIDEFKASPSDALKVANWECRCYSFWRLKSSGRMVRKEMRASFTFILLDGRFEMMVVSSAAIESGTVFLGWLLLDVLEMYVMKFTGRNWRDDVWLMGTTGRTLFGVEV